jgi:hypothetical protein
MISLSRHECNLGLSIAGVIWRTYGGKKTTTSIISTEPSFGRFVVNSIIRPIDFR